MDPTYKVLKAIAKANPKSRLPEVWKGLDYRHWEGTRMSNGELTGLYAPTSSLPQPLPHGPCLSPAHQLLTHECSRRTLHCAHKYRLQPCATGSARAHCRRPLDD
jgi:hypothetical protein